MLCTSFRSTPLDRGFSLRSIEAILAKPQDDGFYHYRDSIRTSLDFTAENKSILKTECNDKLLNPGDAQLTKPVA